MEYYNETKTKKILKNIKESYTKKFPIMLYTWH